MKKVYHGAERRQFIRLEYTAPLAYKICKKGTVSKLVSGYTADISQSGLLCRIKDKVNKNDLLWLSFNRDTLDICQDIEKRSLIYQNGIIGKVVRVKPQGKDDYRVGIQFITREEKNLTNIYPKVYFLEKQMQEKRA
ncbi:MAG: PilZ domain-containing protein [Candidatus Omnitrophica bacterium]|nr:PilZ domain-containing protein [Candidatus Omnitrophota bacterium]